MCILQAGVRIRGEVTRIRPTSKKLDPGPNPAAKTKKTRIRNPVARVSMNEGSFVLKFIDIERREEPVHIMGLISNGSSEYDAHVWVIACNFICSKHFLFG